MADSAAHPRWFDEVRGTLVPGADAHGPLPPLLLVLTLVTGLVDAFSYLELSHVFVANMTGNVVFLGFSAGGSTGFIWWASLLAIVAFGLGALVSGRLTAGRRHHRGLSLRTTTATQTVLVTAGTLVAVFAGEDVSDLLLGVLVTLLALAMGMQNQTARALGVPDLTTTVLTLTITGIFADARPVGGAGSKIGRRLLSVLSMFVGALIGALLVERLEAGWVALAVAAVLLAAVTLLAGRTVRHNHDWTRPPGK